MNNKSEFIGDSKYIAQIKKIIKGLAKTNIPILLRGETGVGKEVAAHSIHEQSDRKDKPFKIVNCPGMTETLAESELFGHEKGTYTSADRERPGLLLEAHGGTLFFDEIGDLPLSIQLKLLRFLGGDINDNGHGREIRQIGKTDVEHVDVRIIAATNQNIEKLISEGKFRNDFYHRINSFPIFIPPLNKRGNDISLLIQYFLKEFNKSDYLKDKDIEISDNAKQMLLNYSWPGNVRELKNSLSAAIIRAGVIGKRDEILPKDIIFSNSKLNNPEFNFLLTNLSLTSLNINEANLIIEKEFVVKALHVTKGNKQKASELLGISRPSIYTLIYKFGLEDKN